MDLTHMFPLVFSSGINGHKSMITDALSWMNEEFERYISATNEVPWFYNERAVLGFFISGLIRRSDAVVLQEFSCDKGQAQNKDSNLGRADLYFKLDADKFLVEAKFCFTSANTEDNGHNSAAQWALKALAQANTYAKAAEVDSSNIFSLCFEAVYLPKEGSNNVSV